MKTSVIIPTFNEKGFLEKCIESLGGQKYSDFEIIVVDDGSTDGTLEVLRNLKKSIKNFKFIRQSHLGAGAARNLGASFSEGKILVFVDADMTFDDNFLSALIEPIKKGKAKGTFSKEEYVANWESVWSRCWNINEGWESKKRHKGNHPDYQPVFRAVLKSEFVKVGGFTPGGYNDDWSLARKLGYEAVNAPGAIFYHKNPASLVEVFNHAKWVGKREYKLGYIGYFWALVRASLPVSLIVGFIKSLFSSEPAFIVFKITYDLGIFIGVLSFIITRNASK